MHGHHQATRQLQIIICTLLPDQQSSHHATLGAIEAAELSCFGID